MAIVASSVVKEYKRREKKFRAVDDVSIEVPKGKITVVMGHSGSGKSTLIGILSGMIRPEAGVVSIDGKDIQDKSNRQRDKIRAATIGMIPQSQSLIGGLTVYENIKLQSAFSKAGTDSDGKALDDMIGDLGLSEVRNMLPHRLSGGEMKRAAIARALSGNHDYIFADEPTGELDSENSDRVVNAFRKKADEGKGILIITHDSLVAEKADILYHMENGTLSK
ncbi:MAG: ATP-binding cassette domain-containing protein [Butyrivibrio sp.]|nr:ATP-binding cassette domain-containing protein [Butyrivibrio sp.]